MGRKCVAVLDVRSYEVAVIIGERGVNNTFVFKASKTEVYDGYDENAQFFNKHKLADAIIRAISGVEKMCGERIKEMYVGVPGAFCTVEPKERTISFPKKRKIGQKEIDALFASGNKQKEGYRFIRATSMIYITADNRRVVDPIGLSSTMLSGVLSYFYCKNYFAETMEEIFRDMKIQLHFLPASFAMASYLVPSETRDECALFIDVGFLSSTMLVLLGNGVLDEKTFWVGKGQIAARIMESFGMPCDAALALLAKANLYAKSNAGKWEFIYGNVVYEIDSDALIEVVKMGLDDICEAAGGYLDEISDKDLENKPLYVSGEGLYEIRGALEHVSKRLSRVCEQLAPDLPYYNKPSMSSRIALTDMAYDDHRSGGILHRIFNGFGG